MPRSNTTQTPYDGANTTAAEKSFTTAMAYTAALEEKAKAQAKRIVELKASMDSQTVLTEATNYEESAVTTGGASKDLKELMETTKQLAASVTNQAATLAALSTKTNSGSVGGGGENTENKKARPGLHVCAHCKREVYHKEIN